MKSLNLLKSISTFSLFIVFLLFSNWSIAQEYTTTPLTGADIDPVNGITFDDPVCLSPNVCGNYTTCSYLSYIELGIDPLSDPGITYLSGIYKIEVQVELDYINNAGNPETNEPHTLNIEFNKDGGVFVNKDRVVIDGGYVMNMDITGVTYRDPSNNVLANADIPAEAYIYLGANVDRFEPLDLAANTTLMYPSVGSFDFFIDISWTDIPNATSYDLEWLWIDTEFINPAQDQFNFKYNSTRINTENTSYRISNIYRKGAFIARVRAIGRTTACDEYLPGDWTEPSGMDFSELNSNEYISLEGHNENFNWQHTRTYAEEGKHKDAITYFDGTMRSRQMVSRLESDGHAIVSEDYYDHVGRVAIKALPAPFIQGTSYAQNLDYYDNFNTSGGNPYNRSHFEKDDPSCLSIPDPMDASGSGQYYSSSNTITDGHQAYVPDAFGFPFAQTIYTQDQTARIRFQGGVGNTHQLGQGHETKHYFGVPEQQEIDRLFGNDVGYAQYYEKNLLVDANGQVAVNYMNKDGRIIATALAGATPNSLDALPSYHDPVNNFTVDSDLSPLNTPNDEGTPGASLSITKQFLVSEDGTSYTYNYAMTPQDFTDPECAPDICFDCAYEVKLVIYDECGNVIKENLPEEGSIDPIDNVIDGACETNADHTFPLEVDLNIGSYGLNKVLSLNNQTMNAYEELYVEAYECIISEVEIFDNLISNADLTGCVDQACLGLCQTEVDITNYENDPDGYVAALSDCLSAKIESGECMVAEGEDIDQCGAFKMLLLSDLSPFGQYGTVTNANNEIQRLGLPCTSFYAEDNIFGLSYEDINYGGILVNVNGTDVSPATLTLSEFVTYFDESWLTAGSNSANWILALHPEYAYLNWCETANVASSDFDENLLYYTADEAEMNGYLNPLNMPEAAAYNIGTIGTGAISGATYFEISNDKLNDLEDDMIVFFPFDDGSTQIDYTIWDFAYMIALSNILDVNAILENDPPASGTWDDLYGVNLCRSERFWEVFRGLYASLKAQHGQEALRDYIETNSSPADLDIIDNCIGSTGSCQNCDEWATILKRYFGYEDVADEDGNPIGGDLTGGVNYDGIFNGTVDPDDEINAEVLEECQNICASYRDQWAEELAGCGLDPMTTLPALLDVLESICAGGCDETHILGATSNPMTGETFSAALITALAGTPMSAMCNDLLITVPSTYDTDIFGGTQSYIDQCVCDRYNDVFDDYSVGQSNPNFDGFYTYLQNTYEVTYEDDVLLDLDCACRNVDSPYLMDNPTGTLGIPEPFACVACIDCDQASAVYADFLASDYNYYGAITSETLEDPDFRSILTTWLNQELSFNLSFNEYIDFFAYCGFGVNIIPFQGEGSQLSAVPDQGFVEINKQRMPRGDPEYQNLLAKMANANLVFELKANQQTTQAGGTVSYDITITNNGAQAINFDYYDQLPGGWTFTEFPTNLYGGTLNSSIGDNDMVVDNVTLAAGETILWTVSTLVTQQAYIARSYYHQARIIETAFAPPDTTYSDDPTTTGANQSMDPTGVFLEITDPCLGPVEEADDLVAFLNELIGIVGTNPSYPIEIPLNTVTTFGPNSSLNLWPYLDFDNLNLLIPDPSTTSGEITLMFENDCGISDLLCAFALKGIGDLSEIQSVNHASPLGVTNNEGNFILQLDITTSENIETTILACSSCYSLVPCDKRLLCNRSITFEGEPTANCLDYVFDILALQASQEYETLIDESRERFRLGYSLQCLGTTDQLDQSYTSREYHHTLYYYDQSGSLVRTVPPNGVDVLNVSELTDVEAFRAGTISTAKYPNHTYRTDYQFNSFNKTILQDSPDATEIEHFYDDLGRVVVTQNGRQRDAIKYPAPRHSYTIYDKQGRIIETGEIIHNAGNPITQAIAFDQNQLATWLTAGVERVQVVKTIYDENLEDTGNGLNIDSYFNSPRVYLRKRVSSNIFFESILPTDPPFDYDHASHYDYDVHGNIKTLIQEFSSLENINQHLKYFEYDYDIISGNIHQVSYQPGQADAFYQRYLYDSDNRTTDVFTSQDGLIWDKDATYEYYDHGPLARTELGEYKVQGCDYAYTLQGWIKGVNSNTLDEDRDIGQDGKVNGSHESIAADAYGFSLGFYTNDYSAIANTSSTWLATEPNLNNKDLFNANIRSMISAIRKPDGQLLENTPNVYTYDQLRRIKSMQKYDAIDQTNNSWANSLTTDAFKTSYTYDPNGNLDTLTRRDANNDIDELIYDYNMGTNLLTRVDDAKGSTVGDIDGQGLNNYRYDDSGNLLEDASENIASIEWNVTGKIREIIRTSSTNLSNQPNVSYRYDIEGNRIIKRVQKGTNPSDWTYTYYVRDIQGNVMGVYEGRNNSQANSETMEDLFEREFHFYGAKRLGIKQSDKPTEDLENYTIPVGTTSRVSGKRNFELSNHLNNVLVTVSDNKLLALNGSNEPKYKSEILSYSDYYPFGWTMPERNASTGDYRYGYNGKEKDSDLSGNQNLVAYDYGFRIYNPSIARFLSVDPLTSNYPFYTPYQFAGNTPIQAIDLDGLEEKEVVGDTWKLSVDMCSAPKSYKSANGTTTVKTTYNLYGYPRNNLYFWEKFIQQYPDALDEWNKGQVLVEGRSPRVTKALKKNFKGLGVDVSHWKIGEIIDHHHVNQKGQSVPLSRSEHKKVKHLNVKQRLKLLGRRANTVTGALDVIAAYKGDPESWMRWFDNSLKVGVIKKNVESGLYYTPMKIDKGEHDGEIYFTIYSAYRYDKERGKYIGENIVGYGWKYEQASGYSETWIYDEGGDVKDIQFEGIREPGDGSGMH